MVKKRRKANINRVVEHRIKGSAKIDEGLYLVECADNKGETSFIVMEEDITHMGEYRRVCDCGNEIYLNYMRGEDSITIYNDADSVMAEEFRRMNFYRAPRVSF